MSLRAEAASEAWQAARQCHRSRLPPRLLRHYVPRNDRRELVLRSSPWGALVLTISPFLPEAISINKGAQPVPANTSLLAAKYL